jgi:hypothetical protein
MELLAMKVVELSLAVVRLESLALSVKPTLMNAPPILAPTVLYAQMLSIHSLARVCQECQAQVAKSTSTNVLPTLVKTVRHAPML